MKTMRLMAALMIGSLVPQSGATSVYGDVICPLFEIDTTNNPDYSSYYGDICPGHGADLLDAAPGLFEFCGNCDNATQCGADCVAYGVATPSNIQKMSHGASAAGMKLTRANIPNKPRKLVNTNKCTAVHLSSSFITFTPPGKPAILAQLYLTLATPTDLTKHSPKIFGTGHEITALPAGAAAGLVPVNITIKVVSPSVYQITLRGVEYQVITTPKP